METLIAANVVMSVAAALQASVGIGMALLAVPLLALLEPKLVPGPMLLAGSLITIVSAWREREHLELKGTGAALAGLALGTVAGALLLHALRIEHLDKLFAALVLVAVTISVCGVDLRPTRPALFAGGGASGLMGTMAGIHGPPMALVMQHARPEQARAVLGAFFSVAYLGSVGALAAAGFFGMPELKLALGIFPGVAAGVLVAPLIYRRLNRARLRFAILAISTISALVLLFR